MITYEQVDVQDTILPDKEIRTARRKKEKGKKNRHPMHIIQGLASIPPPQQFEPHKRGIISPPPPLFPAKPLPFSKLLRSNLSIYPKGRPKSKVKTQKYNDQKLRKF